MPGVGLCVDVGVGGWVRTEQGVSDLGHGVYVLFVYGRAALCGLALIPETRRRSQRQHAPDRPVQPVARSERRAVQKESLQRRVVGSAPPDDNRRRDALRNDTIATGRGPLASGGRCDDVGSVPALSLERQEDWRPARFDANLSISRSAAHDR